STLYTHYTYHLFVIVLIFSFIDLIFFSFLFFFNAPATTEIYTLSLHDALPISGGVVRADLLQTVVDDVEVADLPEVEAHELGGPDRKSTRLNSSHDQISYAVFCLKKKKKKK